MPEPMPAPAPDLAERVETQLYIVGSREDAERASGRFPLAVRSLLEGSHVEYVASALAIPKDPRSQAKPVLFLDSHGVREYFQEQYGALVARMEKLLDLPPRGA